MTRSRPTIAITRFGYGYAAAGRGPSGPDALMAQLARPDPYLERPRIAPLQERLDWFKANRASRLAGQDKAANASELKRQAGELRQRIIIADGRWQFIRPLTSAEGFRERLVAFWTDHFTVAATDRRLSLLVPDLIQTAIRPHVIGNFADMLKAVTTHPAMLGYLNQAQSFGPASLAGLRRKRGLNENLAREILELHTLGVDGGYAQKDVRQFAELLTGLSVNGDGFVFAPNRAEPGPETVLGRSYGEDNRAQLDHIFAALEDISNRPETARHIARKLVVHFVGDPVDEDHVAELARVFAATGGALGPVTEALVMHEAAWVPEARKARTPFEFQIAVLRALGVTRQQILPLSSRELRNGFATPLVAMGQPLLTPGGPDGWPEDPAYWITPAALSARIKWAHAAVEKLGGDTDPRQLLKLALRDAASPVLTRAVAGAESKEEGMTLVFASPEFNRR